MHAQRAHRKVFKVSAGADLVPQLLAVAASHLCDAEGGGGCFDPGAAARLLAGLAQSPGFPTVRLMLAAADKAAVRACCVALDAHPATARDAAAARAAFGL